MCVYIYIYIYIHTCGGMVPGPREDAMHSTANLRTNLMDFREFGSSITFIMRGGIPRSIGNCPQSLTQAMLVGVMLVGGLGVHHDTMRRGMVTVWYRTKRDTFNIQYAICNTSSDRHHIYIYI